MYPHRIRLRGPWRCEPLQRLPQETDAPLPVPFVTTLPNRWRDGGLPGFAGRARFRRRFGYPGRIDDYERVWLTFAGTAGAAEIRLNGQLLGPIEISSQTAEFEVTARLEARNELVVEVESADDAGGIWGEIALEVRCTAYLRNVRFERIGHRDSPRLRIIGEVVGMCERALDLYAIAGRSTVAYRTVEASPAGEPFELLGDPMPGAVDDELPVRVELVNGACVWFVAEGLYCGPGNYSKREENASQDRVE